MKIPFFDLKQEYVTDHKVYLKAIENSLATGTYIGGPDVEAFENEFANYTGAKYCVTLANGLDAIRLLLLAHGIGPGDEVIVPGFTFFATWLAVTQVGAVPVPVDVSLETACLRSNLVEQALTKRTKAILVVHLFGNVAEIDKLRTIAASRGLLMLEDCAQAHGGTAGDKKVGNLADGGAFSFYPTKNLGAFGDAGAVTTNSEVIAERLKSLRSYGVGKTKYEHVSLGWNSRMDPLQASVLKTKLASLDSQNQKRKEIAGAYAKALGDSIDVRVSSSTSDSVFHHFVIRSKDRDATRNFLAENGIGSDIHYPYHFYSVPAMLAYVREEGVDLGVLPNSIALSNEVVSLPIFPSLSKESISWVCEILASSKFKRTLG